MNSNNQSTSICDVNDAGKVIQIFAFPNVNRKIVKIDGYLSIYLYFLSFLSMEFSLKYIYGNLRYTEHLLTYTFSNMINIVLCEYICIYIYILNLWMSHEKSIWKMQQVKLHVQKKVKKSGNLITPAVIGIKWKPLHCVWGCNRRSAVKWTFVPFYWEEPSSALS